MKFYIETYGCQMNVVDSEIVVSILTQNGYEHTENVADTDIVLINPCSIRENAEQRVRGRLDVFKHIKKTKKTLQIGIIGCMAERLKTKLLEEEKLVDLVVGPDAYRDLPKLLEDVENGQQAINVLLSRGETYADINPVRLDKNSVSAYISIMRGCDNMCAYCVVPFTRGRERSRNPESILAEATDLFNSGYKEITLLGQNVDKYKWNESLNFAGLLNLVAEKLPQMRIRFSTSYPQDMTDEVLHTMAKYTNICKYIHLPVQSGSTNILTAMKRGYTREFYLERIKAIRQILPDCGISSDFIAGFCSETDQDHQATISLMQEVRFDFAYMFKYSERPNTYAHRQMKDDVSEEIKGQRLTEIIDLQNIHSLESNKADIGKTFDVLIEGVSQRDAGNLFGRNSQNKVVVFPAEGKKIGQYAEVKIINCSSATLKGEIVKKSFDL